MVDIRTVSLPGIWAEDAQTTIPTPPIANTTYRNTEWGETEANQGWPFQKIVDSADFNQAMWYLFTLQKMQEQFGILPWCSTTEYKQGGLTIGSNGIFYVAVQDNVAQNPVSDSSNTYWKVFIDPSQVYATSGYVDGQIALCEKLANKVQSLSASSTIDQYPSAKAVWDNLALKQTIANMVQSVSASSTTTQYPSAKAVWDAVAGFSPSLYELVSNKAQDLTSPSATTYPSTQAVANESSRIISIMDNIDIAPAWGSPIGISSWPYTAPEHGWIIAGITRPANGNYQGFLNVNGSIHICSYMSNINTSSGYGNTQVMVRKKDIINIAGNLSVNYAYFIRLPLNKYPS